MGTAILVDTDVMVDYLRGHEKAAFYLKGQADRVILSSIVVAELYAGVDGEAEREMLDDVVSLFRVVAVDAEIGRLGGLLKREYGKSHGVGLADAILAATARVENAKLATLHVKHYPMLPGLKPAYVKK
jgi:predicted nucleic acid-binding protein